MTQQKVSIYCRCSTEIQDTDNQLIPLREYASRMNYIIIEEYIDFGISGSKSRTDRPSLDKLLIDANKNKFSKVLIWDISRLGRSLSNLIEVLNELQTLNIDIYFLQQGIDTSTTHGRMIFQIMGSLAEWEKELIKERINAGISRAKSQGKHCGRPSTINSSLVSAVKLLREKEFGIRKISKELNIGVCTVYSIINKN